MNEFRSVISTDKAPQGRGPFPQALRVGQMVFVSGQGPLDPAANAPIAGTFSEQDIGDLNQDGRRAIHERSGRWSPKHPAKRGEHDSLVIGVVEAVVRGRANGQIIEPLQKSLLIEEECLLAADLEVVVSRNIGWKFHA